VFCSFSSRRDQPVRADRLLHSETVPTRAPVFRRRFPAQRSFCLLFRLAARSRPCGTVRGSLSIPESCDSVPARANVSFRVPARPSGDVPRWAPGSSGPPGADETGEIRASRRVSHFGLGRATQRWRFLPPRVSVPLASDAPVASFSVLARIVFGESALASKAAKIDSALAP